MLAILTAGRLGVTWQLPEGARVLSDEETHAPLVHDATATTWSVVFFRKCRLNIGLADDRDGFRMLAQHYARDMFDDVFRQRPHADDRPPRTSDGAWTPLVDFDVVDDGGAPALRLVHRMTYEPGSEVVMGHLLIPLPDGLFEVRIVSEGLDRTTGYRESVLAMKAMAASSSPMPVFLPQAEYDARENDVAFPHHPL